MSSSMKLGHKAKELIFADPPFFDAMNKVRRLIDQFPAESASNRSHHHNNNNYNADTQNLVRIAAHILEQENKL